MKLVRKPLKDVKVGDVLIDSDARLTTVTGETVEETPTQLFELEILSTEGARTKVRADAGHAWPLDPAAYGAVPPEAEGETEASTGDIARWVARGWQPRLSPVMADGTVVHWIVRRARLLSDKITSDTKVKCVQVDSPTHSFMLADDVQDSPGDEIHCEIDGEPDATNGEPLTIDDLAEMDLDDAPGVMRVDREAFDLIAKHGVPTHNCGGPLTLDTMLRTANGSVSMGDVQPGDMILNPVGVETEVLWKSPLMIPESIMRLTIIPTEAEIPGWTMDELIKAEEEWSGAKDLPDDLKVAEPYDLEDSVAWGVDDAPSTHDRFDAPAPPISYDDGGVFTVRCDETHLWTIYDRMDGHVKVLSMGEIFARGVDDWLVPLAGGHWGEIVRVDVMDPEPVQCVLVDDPSHAYQLESGVITHNTGGGKSVLQRNVVFHVIAHARQIKFFGIDLKKVELSAYRPYSPVLYIATTLEDAVQVLTTAQDLMMSRYAEMEENHVNNFLDLDNPGSALLVMVDEAGELLDCSSPAKALGGDTPVKTLEQGMIKLEEVNPGDHVLGTDLEWHEVMKKYQPESQDHYKVTTVRSSDGAREPFVSGAEHLWRVWAPGDLRSDLLRIVSAAEGEIVEDHDDGSLSAVVTTKKLKALKDVLPAEEWESIRLRREIASD